MATTVSKSGIITTHRGDEFKFPLFINNGTLLNPVKYDIKDHEEVKIYLAVMEPNLPFERALIKLVYDSNSEVDEEGNLLIKFLPKDTEFVKPGTYYYMIKLEDEENGVVTIIPLTLFYIC